MKDSLTGWRKEIDMIDDQIISLLAKRISIVKKIGKYKMSHQIPPLDKKRWDQLLESLIAKGERLHLDKSFIKKLYTTIHTHTVSVQKTLQ
jgi:chorismate mutase